jgi:hypothetical protein
MSAGGLLLTPAPVAAAWERVLTVDFFSDGNYGNGAGRVTTDDGGIDCTQDRGFESGDCSEHFVFPDFLPYYDVTFTYDPADGSYVCVLAVMVCYEGGATQTRTIRFERGSGGNYTDTPSFNLRSFRVEVDVDGPGKVDANGTPCIIDGEYVLCREYKYGTEVTVTATPDQGYPFNFWEGGPCAGQDATCTFTVQGETELTAFFGRYSVTIRGSPGGGLCLPDYEMCVGSDGAKRINLMKGTTIKAVALPDAGREFKGWSSGPCSGKPAACTFTLTAAVELRATFGVPATPSPTKTPSPKPTATPATPTPRPSAAGSNATPAASQGVPSASAGSGTAPSGSTPPATPPIASASAPVATPPGGSAPAASLDPGSAAGPDSSAAPGASGPPLASGTPGEAGTSGLALAVVGLAVAVVVVGLGFVLGRSRRASAGSEGER